MGSRTRGNIGGSGLPTSRQAWSAYKFNPRKLVENGKFVTKENLDIYLSGDYITCLECLQDCRSLGQHLSYTHSMSSLEYKIKYNIPKGRSLRGDSTRKLAAEASKQQWIDADERREGMKQHAKDKLVGVGTRAPRIGPRVQRVASFNNGHKKICLACKQPFIAAFKRYKFCGRKCYAGREIQECDIENSRKGGNTRAKTGKRNTLGRFEKAGK